MDFHHMKRKELQSLCKKHNLLSNGTNLQLAEALSALLNKAQEEVVVNTKRPSCLKGSSRELVQDSDGNQVELGLIAKNPKKVRFLVEGDNRGDARKFFARSRRGRSGDEVVGGKRRESVRVTWSRKSEAEDIGVQMRGGRSDGIDWGKQEASAWNTRSRKSLLGDDLPPREKKRSRMESGCGGVTVESDAGSGNELNGTRPKVLKTARRFTRSFVNFAAGVSVERDVGSEDERNGVRPKVLKTARQLMRSFVNSAASASEDGGLHRNEVVDVPMRMTTDAEENTVWGRKKGRDEALGKVQMPGRTTRSRVQKSFLEDAAEVLIVERRKTRKGSELERNEVENVNGSSKEKNKSSKSKMRVEGQLKSFSQAGDRNESYEMHFQETSMKCGRKGSSQETVVKTQVLGRTTRSQTKKLLAGDVTEVPIFERRKTRSGSELERNEAENVEGGGKENKKFRKSKNSGQPENQNESNEMHSQEVSMEGRKKENVETVDSMHMPVRTTRSQAQKVLFGDSIELPSAKKRKIGKGSELKRDEMYSQESKSDVEAGKNQRDDSAGKMHVLGRTTRSQALRFLLGDVGEFSMVENTKAKKASELGRDEAENVNSYWKGKRKSGKSENGMEVHKSLKKGDEVKGQSKKSGQLGGENALNETHSKNFVATRQLSRSSLKFGVSAVAEGEMQIDVAAKVPEEVVSNVKESEVDGRKKCSKHAVEEMQIPVRTTRSQAQKSQVVDVTKLPVVQERKHKEKSGVEKSVEGNVSGERQDKEKPSKSKSKVDNGKSLEAGQVKRDVKNNGKAGKSSQVTEMHSRPERLTRQSSRRIPNTLAVPADSDMQKSEVIEHKELKRRSRRKDAQIAVSVAKIGIGHANETEVANDTGVENEQEAVPLRRSKRHTPSKDDVCIFTNGHKGGRKRTRGLGFSGGVVDVMVIAENKLTSAKVVEVRSGMAETPIELNRGSSDCVDAKESTGAVIACKVLEDVFGVINIRATPQVDHNGCMDKAHVEEESSVSDANKDDEIRIHDKSSLCHQEKGAEGFVHVMDAVDVPQLECRENPVEAPAFVQTVSFPSVCDNYDLSQPRIHEDNEQGKAIIYSSGMADGSETVKKLSEDGPVCLSEGSLASSLQLSQKECVYEYHGAPECEVQASDQGFALLARGDSEVISHDIRITQNNVESEDGCIGGKDFSAEVCSVIENSKGVDVSEPELQNIEECDAKYPTNALMQCNALGGEENGSDPSGTMVAYVEFQLASGTIIKDAVGGCETGMRLKGDSEDVNGRNESDGDNLSRVAFEESQVASETIKEDADECRMTNMWLKDDYGEDEINVQQEGNGRDVVDIGNAQTIDGYKFDDDRLENFVPDEKGSPDKNTDLRDDGWSSGTLITPKQSVESYATFDYNGLLDFRDVEEDESTQVCKQDCDLKVALVNETSGSENGSSQTDLEDNDVKHGEEAGNCTEQRVVSTEFQDASQTVPKYGDRSHIIPLELRDTCKENDRRDLKTLYDNAEAVNGKEKAEVLDKLDNDGNSVATINIPGMLEGCKTGEPPHSGQKNCLGDDILESCSQGTPLYAFECDLSTKETELAESGSLPSKTPSADVGAEHWKQVSAGNGIAMSKSDESHDAGAEEENSFSNGNVRTLKLKHTEIPVLGSLEVEDIIPACKHAQAILKNDLEGPAEDGVDAKDTKGVIMIDFQGIFYEAGKNGDKDCKIVGKFKTGCENAEKRQASSSDVKGGGDVTADENIERLTHQCDNGEFSRESVVVTCQTSGLLENEETKEMATLGIYANALSPNPRGTDKREVDLSGFTKQVSCEETSFDGLDVEGNSAKSVCDAVADAEQVKNQSPSSCVESKKESEEAEISGAQLTEILIQEEINEDFDAKDVSEHDYECGQNPVVVAQCAQKKFECEGVDTVLEMEGYHGRFMCYGDHKVLQNIQREECKETLNRTSKEYAFEDIIREDNMPNPNHEVYFMGCGGTKIRKYADSKKENFVRDKCEESICLKSGQAEEQRANGKTSDMNEAGADCLPALNVLEYREGHQETQFARPDTLSGESTEMQFARDNHDGGNTLLSTGEDMHSTDDIRLEMTGFQEDKDIRVAEESCELLEKLEALRSVQQTVEEDDVCLDSNENADNEADSNAAALATEEKEVTDAKLSKEWNSNYDNAEGFVGDGENVGIPSTKPASDGSRVSSVRISLNVSVEECFKDATEFAEPQGVNLKEFDATFAPGEVRENQVKWVSDDSDCGTTIAIEPSKVELSVDYQGVEMRDNEAENVSGAQETEFFLKETWAAAMEANQEELESRTEVLEFFNLDKLDCENDDEVEKVKGSSRSVIEELGCINHEGVNENTDKEDEFACQDTRVLGRAKAAENETKCLAHLASHGGIKNQGLKESRRMEADVQADALGKELHDHACENYVNMRSPASSREDLHHADRLEFTGSDVQAETLSRELIDHAFENYVNMGTPASTRVDLRHADDRLDMTGSLDGKDAGMEKVSELGGKLEAFSSLKQSFEVGIDSLDSKECLWSDTDAQITLEEEFADTEEWKFDSDNLEAVAGDNQNLEIPGQDFESDGCRTSLNFAFHVTDDEHLQDPREFTELQGNEEVGDPDFVVGIDDIRSPVSVYSNRSKNEAFAAKARDSTWSSLSKNLSVEHVSHRSGKLATQVEEISDAFNELWISTVQPRRFWRVGVQTSLSIENLEQEKISMIMKENAPLVKLGQLSNFKSSESANGACRRRALQDLKMVEEK